MINKEKYRVSKQQRMEARRAHIHTCQQCGGQRFKTIKKAQRVFGCRKCGAVYQD